MKKIEKKLACWGKPRFASPVAASDATNQQTNQQTRTMKQAASAGIGARIFFQSLDIVIQRYASRAVRTGEEFEVRFGAGDGPEIVALEATPGPYGPTILFLGHGRTLIALHQTVEAQWKPTGEEGISAFKLGDWNAEGGLTIRRQHQSEQLWFHDPAARASAFGFF